MNSCSYHPTRAAHYHCPKCDAHFCPDCISKRSKAEYGISKDLLFCPKCNVPVKMLNVGSFIAPFWTRLPKFFAYPLQFKPLLLILVLSAAGVLLSWVPLIQLILWGVLIKYSYAVLRSTVNGSLRPPDLSYEVLGEDFGQAFKQIALFLVVGVAVAVAFAQLGPALGFLCLFFALLLVPAMIIVLAVSSSLINALNPVTFVTIAFRIGWGYLLMYLFLALLLAAPAILADSVASFMSPVLRKFLFLAANQYYTIITYNLMGYVMLQYHSEIGYEVSAEDFVDQSPVLQREFASADETRQDPTEAILNQVNILIKDGRADDAAILMRDRLRGRSGDRVLCERYYNLLKITQRVPEMLTHGVDYLDLITAENDRSTGCEVYKECLALDPQFTPNPDALFKIGAWCMEDGDLKNGLNALVRFIKVNPHHALVPKAQFLFGKNVYEKLHNFDRAEKALKALVQKYPDHDITAHARKYLELMKRTKLADVG
jgi:hypothetical protein